MFSKIVLSSLVAFGFVASDPALAQQQQQRQACAKRVDLMKHLEERYKEVPAAVGLADNGGVLEVYASIDGSTWTVMITLPNGVSCMLATGENWEALPRIAAMGPPA
ncbi:MAG: hypothetical protein HY246_16800 [Proteobacteria bacterium]|nr:hypothetical protein [Pseudomonadota bacterium]